VGALHGQDEIGALNEVGRDHAAAMARDVELSSGGNLDGFGGGRAPVERESGRRDGGVDLPIAELFAQERFRHRRTADVAGAQHQDVDGILDAVDCRQPPAVAYR
jgi:hypothetical protein